MAQEILANLPSADTITKLSKNTELQKKELSERVKEMELNLIYDCEKAILFMEQKRITKYKFTHGFLFRPQKLFLKGVPNMNIPSPFETIKKILDDKGFKLKCTFSIFIECDEFVLKCKN